MNKDDLVGAWGLDSWVVEYSDERGRVSLGPDAQGLIVYEPHGHMIVNITEADEVSGVSYFAYGGRYSFDANDVIHHVDISSIPSFVDTDQRREARLDGDELTLSVRFTTSKGVEINNVLTWHRIRD